MRSLGRFIVILTLSVAIVGIGVLIATVIIPELKDDNTPEFTDPNETDPLQVSQVIASQAGGNVTQNILVDPVFQQNTATLRDFENTYARLYEQITPSVVGLEINAIRETTVGEEEVVRNGSGVVYDTNGHIITNYHLLVGAQSVTVNFFGNTTVRAEIVGLDVDSDLGVLRVDVPVEILHPVIFANIDAEVVGQTVLAIGSPFGQNWTLTTGIISALDRNISNIGTQFAVGSGIQTDATIDGINTGGPLINLQGEVIGINSDIFGVTVLNQQSTSSGIGFAIPADYVQRVVTEIIETGGVTYSYIGIQIGAGFLSDGNVTLALIEALNLPSDLHGVVVGAILEDGPAGDTALQGLDIRNNQLISADIITALNGQSIENFNDLVSYLARNTRPGDTITLTVYRASLRETIEVPLTLQARPSAN